MNFAILRLALALICIGIAGATLAQSISAKNGHVLAVDEAGRVVSWGGDSFGQLGVGRSVFEASPRKVLALPAIATLSAGDAHLLALTTGGEVWAWGNNTDGQLGIRDELNNARPAKIRGLTDVISIAAGGNFSAAVTRDGAVYVWGKNPVTKQGLNVPERLEGVRGARSVAAGRAHLLILRTDGTVLSAGENQWGQLGDSTKEPRNVVIRVPRLSGVAQLAAQGEMSTALTSDGRPFSWGTPDLVDPVTQVLSPTLVRDVQVIAGARGTRVAQLLPSSSNVNGSGGGYARFANGDVMFWRDVNVGLNTRVTFPVDVVSMERTINNGATTAFGLLPNGDVLVTGYNGDGQWGQGSTSDGTFSQVVTVAGLNARSMVANGGYVAVVTASGEVYVWGANSAGVAADGGLAYRAVPNSVVGVQDAVKVVAGRGYSLALTSQGEVFAWGENSSGQLGIGSRTRQSTPRKIPDLTDIVDIAAGCEFSLFLRRDGRVFRSGYAFESLNSGFSTVSFVNTPIKRVFATCETGFLQAENGRLLAFGRNDRGQAGQGNVNTKNVFAPTLVFGLTSEAVQVSGSDLHTVVLTADGKVWTWGDNTRGQLGAPPSPFDATPQFIPNLPRAKAVAAGRFHTLIVFEDGTVGGVGANTGGELGTGTRADTSVVAPTRRLTDVVAVAAGVSTSYAIRADGSTWGWGRSTESAFQEAVGDGTYVDRAEPVLVLSVSAAGNLDRGDWFLDLKPSIANSLPASAGRSIVPVAQLFGGNQGASLAASINFREQDYGKNAATYVMGLVPRDFLDVAEIAAAANPVAMHEEVKRRPKRKNGSDLVLVQLTPTGWQVVTGQLSALTTNVIQGNSAAQRILNNINLALIPGAQFCVGYGTSANDMLQNGTLAEVLTIPGASAVSGGLPCVRSGAYLSGPDESKAGQLVSFIATVVGISPTGTVSLKNGSSVMEAKSLPVGAESIARAVRFEFPALAAGRYTLTADYPGDGTPNNPPAASAPLSHKRQAVPSIAIFAPPVSDAGQTVVFSARLAASSQATGSVVFKDDGVAMGAPVALSASGEASISVRDLSPGAHSISAEYAGDDLNAAVRSSFAHTVRSNAVDTTPEDFGFAEQRDTERDVWVVSEPMTVRGVNAASAISVVGGEYSIECSAIYVGGPGAVDNGQRVCVRHRASMLAQASTRSTLSVGGVSATFVSRTRADPDGLPAEGDFDSDGIPNAIETSEGTNPRAKDNDVFNNARLFTMQVYRDSLDREGDAGGIAFWSEEINRGRQSRQSMLEQFVASPEFEGRIAPVIRLYIAYFSRVPDYAGLKYWQSQMAGGGLDIVSEAFATSGEFATRTRGLSDEDYVRYVFQSTIGRPPDAGGLAFWTAKIRFAEISRGQLMARFSESTEFRALVGDRVAVIALYAAMLRRTPEDSGLAFWSGERRRAGNSQALVGAFLVAPEYRARFLP